ncbi:MAG TPA: Ig-like domain-containing protein, partial [Dokdonella sp.]
MTLPAGFALNADGTIAVPSATPTGSYAVAYRICETINPANCDTATATVAVAAAAIDAIDDAGTPVNGSNGGQAIADVLANDTLSGAAVELADIDLTVVSTTSPRIALDTANGAVNVASGTPAGSHALTYRICEKLNPANCDSAVASVVVVPAPIDAVDDDAGPVDGAAGGVAVANVLANDAFNGGAVVPADVTLAPGGNGPLTINADGTVDVAPATPAATYTADYRICDVLNPSNCDSATVTAIVNAVAIVANDDSATTPQNTPVTLRVIDNDSLGGRPMAAAEVTAIVGTAPANGVVAVNADGSATYTQSANFSGDDSYTYVVCETLNPANCDTALVAIATQPNIVAANDDAAETEQSQPVTIDVLGNDTVTGAPLDTGSLTIASASAHGTASCTAGACTYTPAAGFAGDDSFGYRVCDISVPTPACDTALVTVAVNGEEVSLRLTKQAGQRTAQVGDLVRYTVTAENVGQTDARNVSLLDTLPAGFTYVDASLEIDDGDDAGTLGSANPLRIDGLDIAVGGSATFVYYLRVGAGVGPGVHINRVVAQDPQGDPISNVATAEVEVVGDPLLDDSLIVGSVFDDRDGDGWQDSAKASALRVQGGFAP